MKKLTILILLNLSLLSFAPAYAHDTIPHKQEIDTTVIDELTQETNSVEDEEFNIFLLLFGLAAISFMAGFIFIGIMAAVMFFLLFMGLVSAGVFSISIITGWYQKSISKGVKTFFIVSGIAVGILFGVFGFGLVSMLFDLHLQKHTVLISGAISGTIAGGFLGFIIHKIIKLAAAFARKQLDSTGRKGI